MRQVKKAGAMIVVMLLMIVTSANAQSNTNFINVDLGANILRGVEASIAYEHGTKYHNAWEYFLTYHVSYDTDPECGHITKESFWHNFNTVHFGVVYKPCVTRGRNNHGNVRIGASVGSNVNSALQDFDGFIGGIHVGYEHSFTLYHGWEMFFQIKEDVMIPKRNGELFRTGAAVGFKIPLNKSTYRP